MDSVPGRVQLPSCCPISDGPQHCPGGPLPCALARRRIKRSPRRSSDYRIMELWGTKQKNIQASTSFYRWGKRDLEGKRIPRTSGQQAVRSKLELGHLLPTQGSSSCSRLFPAHVSGLKRKDDEENVLYMPVNEETSVGLRWQQRAGWNRGQTARWWDWGEKATRGSLSSEFSIQSCTCWLLHTDRLTPDALRA